MANLNYDTIQKLHTLTQSEMELVFYLLPLADQHNKVSNISYKDVCDTTSMCPQSFYSSLRSLVDKQILCTQSTQYSIEGENVTWKFHKSDTGYYDIWINNNNTDQRDAYININRKLFVNEKWKKLTPNAKWLLLMLLSYTSAHEYAEHKKDISDFYKEMTILLKRTKRQIRKYLYEIKAFFVVKRNNGVYHIRRNNFLKELLSKESKIYSNQEEPCRRQFVIGSLRGAKLIKKATEENIDDIKSFFCKKYQNRANEKNEDLFKIVKDAINLYAQEIHDTFSAARIRQFVMKALEISN